MLSATDCKRVGIKLRGARMKSREAQVTAITAHSAELVKDMSMPPTWMGTRRSMTN
jgi:hypothetical protein